MFNQIRHNQLTNDNDTDIANVNQLYQDTSTKVFFN